MAFVGWTKSKTLTDPPRVFGGLRPMRVKLGRAIASRFVGGPIVKYWAIRVCAHT